MGKAAPSLLDIAAAQKRRPGKPTCALVTATKARPDLRDQIAELMQAAFTFSLSPEGTRLYAIAAPAAARACQSVGLSGVSGQVFQHHRDQACDYCRAEGLPVMGES